PSRPAQRQRSRGPPGAASSRQARGRRRPDGLPDLAPEKPVVVEHVVSALPAAVGGGGALQDLQGRLLRPATVPLEEGRWRETGGLCKPPLPRHLSLPDGRGRRDA